MTEFPGSLRLKHSLGLASLRRAEKEEPVHIIKRGGQEVPYDSRKIERAIEKAFASLDKQISESELSEIVARIEAEFEPLQARHEELKVETIQDIVERMLMAYSHYDVAKAYILYRFERSRLRSLKDEILKLVDLPGLEAVLTDIAADFPDPRYSLELLLSKFRAFYKAELSAEEGLRLLIRAAVESTTQDAPDWEFVAARLLNLQIEADCRRFMEHRGVRSFAEKVAQWTEEGLYGRYIKQNYSESELNELAKIMVPERNKLFNYSGLELVYRRYLVRTYQQLVVETPQEMFLGIALHLALNEAPEERASWVQRFYEILSQLQVTMATPTLSNARKPYHQLSSCFIDTVPDSLEGIYRSITNFAEVSKLGGGMGLYFGKVRAVGSAIRGFQGVAGGVIRWVKLANDTAVAVDQLGMRQGSVACYLDIWHRDVPEFLQIRTNNGDDRLKAHDVFPGICYPDLFWRTVRDNIEAKWHLLCPHEVYTIKGYHLEDYYGEEWERRYLDCVQDHRISKREIPIKELVRLVLKSCVETGTPFTFNRDAVNRANPNPQAGMIYCSNLCTEICQNMSEIERVQLEIEGEEGSEVIVEKTKPGDFVVCNLASLVLGKIDIDTPDVLEGIVKTVVRALDNVIELNYYPLKYAEYTNRHYRAIGLGVSGYHHLLATHEINWESQEHLDFADRLFERINFAAIEASSKLARERGSYSHFEGSDWQSGEYFKKRQYDSAAWQELAARVARDGLRNSYLLAIAPTSSTSIIAGTSAGLDPIMRRYFLEEKRGSIVPRVAPELSPETFWYYKQAHQIDQSWTIRAAGVRQRHIDQAQSLNLYVTQDLSFRTILSYFIEAWELGVKTIYYCRSLSLEVTECDSCSS